MCRCNVMSDQDCWKKAVQSVLCDDNVRWAGPAQEILHALSPQLALETLTAAETTVGAV